MAMARVGYENGRVSANLGINSGVFPQYNMSHEQELLRMLYEANVGYLITPKLKFTAGMFSSHMGFESILSFDNYLTSHSLSSEWTPYYLSGAKLEYTLNNEWFFGFTVANGNQMLGESPFNSNKLVGIQANYSPTDKITLNYSNMYYNDAPSDSVRLRWYIFRICSIS